MQSERVGRLLQLYPRPARRSSHHPVVRAVVKLVPHTTDQEGDFLEADMSLQIGRAVTSARKRRTREVTAQGKNALTHP